MPRGWAETGYRGQTPHILITPCPGNNLLIEITDLLIQRLGLIGEGRQSEASSLRQASIGRIAHDLDQPGNRRRADGGENAQFRQVSAQRIDRLGLLPDQVRLAIAPYLLGQWPQLSFGQIEILYILDKRVVGADGFADPVGSAPAFIDAKGDAVEIRAGLAEIQSVDRNSVVPPALTYATPRGPMNRILVSSFSPPANG